jgi:transcriptional regulator with GAF, ATPase, and Fis domain
MAAATTTTNWMRTASRILVASSDPKVRQRVLGDPDLWGVERMEACGGAHALAKLRETMCDGVLLDRNLADLDSTEVAELIRREHPHVGVGWIENSQQEGCCGNDSRATRPQTHALALPTWDSREEPELSNALPGMIGTSAAMKNVYQLVHMVAKRDTTVLVTGETGTGKELVAEAIHQLSPRAKQPFVVVNCAAIPEPLIEAELFGHARGAFTGAVQSRLGRIHVAQGGTLFLDEIGELPLGMQAKILRFLQSGEVQRLGSADVHRVDVRVICATNARLGALVATRQFRMDLFYRLAVFPIELPPLRDRAGDIELLAMHFLKLLCAEIQSGEKRLGETALAVLRRRKWQGNVRELQHSVERAFILSGEETELRPEHFPCYEFDADGEAN